MRKLILILTVILMLFGCVSCAAGEMPTPAFAKPTPAVEIAEPTPEPEPIPTEKPQSAYNEKLAWELMIVKPISCWAVEPNDTLYSLKASSDLVALVYVEGKKERIWRDEQIGAEDGCTEAEVRIEKIWAGDSAKEGDTIIVREDCYLSERDNGVTALCTNEDYFPMREHAYYLLFLEDNFDNPGTFMMTCVHYSKFPVNPMVDDLMKAGKKMHYKDLELAQDGWVEYYDFDPRQPMPDVKMLFDEVYEAYYGDDAILKVLEEEREYEKHYGGLKPVEWEPAPESESTLWAFAYYGQNMIFVPTEKIPYEGSLKKIHEQMNDRGFDASQLQTLAVDSNEFRMRMWSYDVFIGARVEDQYGNETIASVYTLNGECLGENIDRYDSGKIERERGGEPVVYSVTTRMYSQDENNAYHAFFIVDFDESYFN